MKQIDWKSMGYHAICLCSIIAAALFYFPDNVFKNYVADTHDISQYVAASAEQGYYQKVTNEQGVWTNAMFSGMPMNAVGISYSGNKLKPIDNFLLGYLNRPVSYMLLGMVGMYFLLSVLQKRKYLALLGALAFGFTCYFFVAMKAGHGTKLHTIAYSAWVLGGVLLVYQQGKWLLGSAIAGVAVALQIKAGHPQISYYMAFVYLAFGITAFLDSIKNKTIGAFFQLSAPLLVAVVLGVAANYDYLYGTSKYNESSNRGGTELTTALGKDDKKDITKGGLSKEYITDYSYGIAETFTLLVANAAGGASESIGAVAERDPKILKNVDEKFQQNVVQMSSYFGKQPFTAGPYYIGSIICFLAFVGLLVSDNKWRWALLGACILALLLAWGKNMSFLTNFMIDNFPAYNKFRAPSMWLTVLNFSLPVLAVLGLKNIMDTVENTQADTIATKDLYKKVGIGAGIIGGITLLLAFAPTMLLDITSDPNMLQAKQSFEQQKATPDVVAGFIGAVKQARINIVSNDALRSLGFIVAALAIVLAFIRFRFHAAFAGIGLAVLVLGDMWGVATRYLNNSMLIEPQTNSYPFQPQSYDEQIYLTEIKQNPALQATIQADVDKYSASISNPEFIDQEKLKNKFSALSFHTNYRVLSFMESTFNDNRTSYFHKSIGGYSAIKLQRYNDIIGRYFSGSGLNQGVNALLTAPMMQANNQPVVLNSSAKILNMLNMKYLVYPNQQQQPVLGNNTLALGNAWFVKKYQVAKGADDEITKLDSLDVANEMVADAVFINTDPNLKSWTYQADTTAKIVQTGFLPGHLTYTYQANTPQLTVFSEVYYEEGWKLLVDGKQSPLLRANYILRAGLLPAGKHTIEMKYEPSFNTKGKTEATISSYLLLLLLAGGIGKEYLDNKKQNAV